LKPDLTVLLDISPEAGFAPQNRAGTGPLRERGPGLSPRVRAGYLKLAEEEPRRWQVIDAALPKEKIKQMIWQKVSSLIEK